MLRVEGRRALNRQLLGYFLTQTIAGILFDSFSEGFKRGPGPAA